MNIQDQISASIAAAGGDDSEIEPNLETSVISQNFETLVDSVPALAVAAERMQASQYLEEIRGVHDQGNEKMLMLEKLREEHSAEKGRYLINPV
jgi:hypothetical protein